MNGWVLEVPGRSRAVIRELTQDIRSHLRIETPWFPIVEIMEFVLPQVLDSYEFEICDVEEMGSNHGLTLPDQRLVKIRSDVYDGACKGSGRDRFTMAHEFGHLMLHQGVAGLPRRVPGTPVKPFRDPEWQANQFAAELLMTVAAVKAQPQSIELVCGVSSQAADLRLRKLREEGLL